MKKSGRKKNLIDFRTIHKMIENCPSLFNEDIKNLFINSGKSTPDSIRKQKARMEGRTAFSADGKEHFFLWRWKADKMKKTMEVGK